MRRWLWSVLTASVLLAACESKKPNRPPRFMLPQQAAQQPSPAPEPQAVVITLHSVLISPAKAGGGGWDVGGSDASQAMGAIGQALSLADPFPQIMGILTGPLVRGVERPEIIGNARLVTWQGGASITPLSAQRDTLTPQFVPQPRFQIDLTGSTRIEVHLVDEDLEFHDPVGHFQIGAQEARQALRAGKITPIRVAEQTNRQVLFVNISAMPVP